MVDYDNTKTPSMHSRLGSATVSQLAFPGEGYPNFPREKSHWDNIVVTSHCYNSVTSYSCVAGVTAVSPVTKVSVSMAVSLITNVSLVTTVSLVTAISHVAAVAVVTTVSLVSPWCQW